MKCFAFQGYGHYVGQCPHKKKNKKKEGSEASTSTEVEEYEKKFKKEFLLFSVLSGSAWLSVRMMKHGTLMAKQHAI